jgi:two-component system, chemotaxis family, chemotaxis protein CheY
MPRRVLIVDDDEDIRDLMGAVLRWKGYDVAVAGSGEAGLAFIRGHAPVELVILDLMMPGMTGAEFKAALDADPRYRAVPVVVISGDLNLARQAEEIGAAAHVLKPFELQELVDIVHRYLSETPRPGEGR